jgi:hypothetical protein
MASWLWAAENAKQTSQAQPFTTNNHDVREQIMATNHPNGSINHYTFTHLLPITVGMQRRPLLPVLCVISMLNVLHSHVSGIKQIVHANPIAPDILNNAQTLVHIFSKVKCNNI